MLRTLFVTVAFVAAISNAVVLEDKINDFQFAEVEQGRRPAAAPAAAAAPAKPKAAPKAGPS